ncbi:hypothetical protein C5L14_26085 [Labrys okinawensis]|uniref:Uncharacterized protein n=1 Tax=Labrys okinawensis TaxID=346911 RepID=A0A2S9Q5M9_9HYPH|nr:hypothetical protein [Labrys okinawensis]PRH84656.1 hypothetical protein C5L14_26085 [Labrys okinawensis]
MSTDYFPPIQRAVQGLSPNTQETRQALYEKARSALLRQLNAADPALTEGQIARERNLLEEAIRRVEHHYDEAEFTPEPVASERPAAPQSQSDTASTGDEASQDEASTPASPRPNGLPAFAERKAEKRRPQAPRRNRSNGNLRRYALMAATAAIIIGGGAATALYLRGSDDSPVLVPQQATAPQAAPKPAPEPGKLNDRLGGTPAAPQTEVATGNPPPPAPAPATPEPAAPAPQAPSAPAPLLPSAQSEAPEGQRARLMEEDPSAPMKGRLFEGTVNWRTESQASGTNGPLDTVVVGEINVPDRKMKVLLTLRHNSDRSLPANYLLNIQMSVPADYPSGAVGDVKSVNVKSDPQVPGLQLDGALMKVTTGVFLMGLLDPPDEKGRNAKMLQTNQWFDLVFTFANGRNAVFTFEKGPTGEKAFNDAMAAWNADAAAAQ